VDGGTGTDTLVLAGDYSHGVIFAATTMVDVEKIVLGRGTATRSRPPIRPWPPAAT
jgi:hypothetical protein